ncbi:MAG: ribonuclease D [Actinomycetales bacterium]|nr:ribonuclease D [Actinomycetales bacterium]
MQVLTDDEVPEPDDARPAVVPLAEPADGIPPVIDTPAAFAEAVAAFAQGSGPVASDAERASGYRYGQRTYLVQLRRAGAGTALIDPVAVPDLSPMSDALVGVEFVLHAASQDLPGFREQQLWPTSVFDTELGARILGLERVGLATVVAELLGLGLAKEHSAVDWSTRPLPTEWLRYAALDVEVLVALRDAVAERLEAAGKLEWALEEFEAVRTAPPPPPRVDPWRRTSGMHAVRDTRELAVVRELWLARDESARRRDIAPGRVLPDRAIVAAAKAKPKTVAELVALPEFAGKGTRRRADLWQSAIDRARSLPASALPSSRGPRNGESVPPARAWPDRDPEAAARLAAARAALAEISARVNVPVENLALPELVRRLCWSPPSDTSVRGVGDFLAAGGARPWQVELVAAPLSGAMKG